MFTVRRMTPEDKPVMMDISSRIWEGTDYLPAVFDEWVADHVGEFAAALLDGRVVGCGKLTFFTATDAWLEGLRKDPLVRQKGLADAVARYFLSALAARKDLTSIRFSTYVKNLVSIHVNERLGFRRKAALSHKGWEGTREQLTAVSQPAVSRPAAEDGRIRVETVRDERAVLEFLDRVGYFAASAGMVVEGWRARPFSPQLIVERYVRSGCCRGVVSARPAGSRRPAGGRRGGKLAGLAIRVPDRLLSRVLVKLVCLDAVDDETADALFDDLFLAAKAAIPAAANTPADPRADAPAATVEIEWQVPAVDRLKRWCAGHGLKSWEQEDDFLVYELPLEALRGFAKGSGGREP